MTVKKQIYIESSDEELSELETQPEYELRKIIDGTINIKATAYKVIFMIPIQIKSVKLVFIVFENQEAFFYQIDKVKLTCNRIYQLSSLQYYPVATKQKAHHHHEGEDPHAHKHEHEGHEGHGHTKESAGHGHSHEKAHSSTHIPNNG